MYFHWTMFGLFHLRDRFIGLMNLCADTKRILRMHILRHTSSQVDYAIMRLNFNANFPRCDTDTAPCSYSWSNHVVMSARISSADGEFIANSGGYVTILSQVLSMYLYNVREEMYRLSRNRKRCNFHVRKRGREIERERILFSILHIIFRA